VEIQTKIQEYLRSQQACRLCQNTGAAQTDKSLLFVQNNHGITNSLPHADEIL
jgi:hypothetical protein